MSRNVTLAQLRADVLDQADVAGATVRNVATLINRYLNQSIQLWREKLSISGSQHYLEYVTGTLSTGNTSPFPFQLLDLSSVATALVRSYRFDISVNNEYYPLEQIPFQHMQGYADTTARPRYWAHTQRKTIALYPGPDSAYTYACWYLPVQTDLSDDADTIDGVSGWEQIWVWDTVLKLINRDQYPEAFQMAVGMKTELEAAYMSSANKVTSFGGASIGRDSMGSKLYRGGKPKLPPP